MPIINPNNPNVDVRQQQEMIKFAQVLKSSEDMECELCSHTVFTTVYKIKKVSGLVTGTGKDMIVPISVYACAKCGNINKFFLDKFDETE